MEPRSTREIEMVFNLIDKVPEVGNTADTPNTLDIIIPFLKEIWESPQAKENLAPVRMTFVHLLKFLSSNLQPVSEGFQR